MTDDNLKGADKKLSGKGADRDRGNEFVKTIN